MNDPTQDRWLYGGWYLALTPVFAVVDWILGWPLRAAAIDAADLRLAWYALLLGVGVVCWLLPRLAPFFALLESALSIGMLIVGAYMTILRLPDELGAAPFDAAWLVNLLLCGSIGIMAFHESIRALRPN